MPFDLSGDRSIFEHLHRVLVEKGSAVVVVAEGAGQDMLGPAGGADASGNKKYSDVGKWLAVTPSPSAPSLPTSLSLACPYLAAAVTCVMFGRCTLHRARPLYVARCMPSIASFAA